MKFLTVVIILMACYIAVEFSAAQVTNSTAAPPPGNHSCGGKGHGRKRPARAVHTVELEKKFKEFADKLGKTPEELTAAFGSFVQAQGVSLEQIQKYVKEGNEMVYQLIESIKKAMPE